MGHFINDKDLFSIIDFMETIDREYDTIRQLFPGKVTDEVRNHPLFKSRWFLLDRAEKNVNDLLKIINKRGWVSFIKRNRHCAMMLLPRMDNLLSHYPEMPKGVSGMYKKILSTSAFPRLYGICVKYKRK